MNAYKLSSNLKKDFDSVSNYLNYLKDAGLIRFLMSDRSGHGYLRNPEKMYPENSNLLFAAYLNIHQDNMPGKIRETFALNQLQNAGHQVFFTEQGDFICNGITLEIGGKNKTTAQLKNKENAFVFADGILTGIHNKLPLFWLGFLT